MNQELNNWIDNHRKEIIDSLCAQMRFKSVKSSQDIAYITFGKGVS